MKFIDKNAFISAPDFQLEKIDLPEIDGFVYIRTFSGETRDKIESFLQRTAEKKDSSGFRALMVSFSTCDDKGNLLFDLTEVDKINKKNALVLDRIFKKSLDLNGMSKEAAQAAKERFQEKP